MKRRINRLPRRDRITHAMVTLWMLAFLLIIGPGHTRGIVQLGNTTVAAAPEASFATPTMSAGRSCCRGGSDRPDGPTPPQGKCAICQIIATLDLPAPMVWAAPPAERLGDPPAETSDRVTAHAHALRLSGRAPPESA